MNKANDSEFRQGRSGARMLLLPHSHSVLPPPPSFKWTNLSPHECIKLHLSMCNDENMKVNLLQKSPAILTALESLKSFRMFPSSTIDSTTSSTYLISTSSASERTATDFGLDLFGGDLRYVAATHLPPPPTSSTSSVIKLLGPITSSTSNGDKQPSKMRKLTSCDPKVASCRTTSDSHDLFMPKREKSTLFEERKSFEGSSSQPIMKQQVNISRVRRCEKDQSASSLPFPNFSSSSSSTSSTASSFSAPLSTPRPNWSIRDFDGITSFCQIARNVDEFERFKLTIMSIETVSICIIFADDITSNHATQTVKYCTPGNPCSIWNCNADHHYNVRADQCKKQILGALFVLKENRNMAHLLPLIPTELDSSMNSTMSLNPPSWLPPSIENQHGKPHPLSCETLNDERWTFFYEFLSRENIKKVTFNSQLFLLPILWRALSKEESMGVKVRGLFDIRVASYLLQSDVEDTNLELSVLTSSRNVHATETRETCGFGRIAHLIFKSYEELRSLLSLEELISRDLVSSHMIQLFEKVEMPLCQLLASMEIEGVAFNATKLQVIKNCVAQKRIELEMQARTLTGKDFNLSSPEQVADIIYNYLGLTVTGNADKKQSAVKTAKEKHMSTKEEVLQRIDHPIANLVLNHRRLSKILNTYCVGYEPFFRRDIAIISHHRYHQHEHQVIKDRLHANWNNTTTRTGRLSCSNPNLQQLPKQEKLGDVSLVIDYRSLFESSSETSTLISADYSQIEMRILAHTCGDENMINLLSCQGGDIYLHMASKLFGKPVDSITSQERESAKVISLARIYGQGDHGAAAKLGMPKHEVQKVVRDFKNSFPGIDKWLGTIKSVARENGFTMTLCGRKRFLPDISSPDSSKRSAAERQAANSVIQGGATDVIKVAMLLVDNYIRATFPNVTSRPRLLMQIHDELVYEVPSSCTSPHGRQEVLSFIRGLKKIMEDHTKGYLNIKVPLTAKVKFGSDLSNMEIYESS